MLDEVVNRLHEIADVIDETVIVDHENWRLFLTDEGEGCWNASIYDLSFNQETRWSKELQANDAQDVLDDIDLFHANPRKYICEPWLRFMYRRTGLWLSHKARHAVYLLRCQR